MIVLHVLWYTSKYVHSRMQYQVYLIINSCSSGQDVCYTCVSIFLLPLSHHLCKTCSVLRTMNKAKELKVETINQLINSCFPNNFKCLQKNLNFNVTMYDIVCNQFYSWGPMFRVSQNVFWFAGTHFRW